MVHYKLFCELLIVYTSFSSICEWYTQAPLQAAVGTLQASLRAADGIHKLLCELRMVHHKLILAANCTPQAPLRAVDGTS